MVATMIEKIQASTDEKINAEEQEEVARGVAGIAYGSTFQANTMRQILK